MALHLTVEHRDGGTTKTAVFPITEIAFEERFHPLTWSEAWSLEYPRETWLYFVAWHSIHDEGKTSLTFEEWARTVATVRVELDATKKDTESPPTAPVPLPG